MLGLASRVYVSDFVVASNDTFVHSDKKAPYRCTVIFYVEYMPIYSDTGDHIFIV